jgi:hypothetical protein
MTSLKIKTPILEMEWKPQEADKEAAWDMYIELLTRITTQALPDEDGIEQAVLESIHKMFDITRNVIKAHGRDCIEFTKLAIIILNQIIRPFTVRWHKLSDEGAFSKPESCKAFREELKALQQKLITYTKMLGEIAGVEDLTSIEE